METGTVDERTSGQKRVGTMCERCRKNEPLAILKWKSLALFSRHVRALAGHHQWLMGSDQRMAHSSTSVYTGGTLLFLGLVLSIPAVRDLFDFSLLSPLQLLICLVAGIASFLWFEVLKVVSRQQNAH